LGANYFTKIRPRIFDAVDDLGGRGHHITVVVSTLQSYDADVMELLITDAYTELFESEVNQVLDVYAPLCTKTRRQGSHDRVPLFKEACIAQRTCRWLKRRFRRSGSPYDKQQFNEARSVTRGLIYKSRADVLNAIFIESAGDSKKMWNTARQLLHQHLHSAMKTGLQCQIPSASSSSHGVGAGVLELTRKSLISIEQRMKAGSKR
jgi:hypothetical protein